MQHLSTYDLILTKSKGKSIYAFESDLISSSSSARERKRGFKKVPGRAAVCVLRRWKNKSQPARNI
jgi:hypothetical protein